MSGIHELGAEEYHADIIDDDRPSLSASIAHTLITRSPLHAWTAHPRLNPDFARTEEQKFDIGTVAHAILLEGTDIVYVCDFPDWRTNDAKEARDQARATGRVPLLAHQADDVAAMVEAAKAQLITIDTHPPILTEGKPEQTLVWEEDGVLCRSRVDWLRDDFTAIHDLKTTARSAQPEAYARALFGVGGDVQAAMYLRGLAAVTGSHQWADFSWVVIETAPPYGLSVIRPAPDVLELGNRKVEYAISLWRQCLETGEWPGYSPEVAWAHAPEYEIARWLEREEREAA